MVFGFSAAAALKTTVFVIGFCFKCEVRKFGGKPIKEAYGDGDREVFTAEDDGAVGNEAKGEAAAFYDTVQQFRNVGGIPTDSDMRGESQSMARVFKGGNGFEKGVRGVLESFRESQLCRVKSFPCQVFTYEAELGFPVVEPFGTRLVVAPAIGHFIGDAIFRKSGAALGGDRSETVKEN